MEKVVYNKNPIRESDLYVADISTSTVANTKPLFKKKTSIS